MVLILAFRFLPSYQPQYELYFSLVNSVTSAVFGINGTGVSFVNSQGLIINTKPDGEIYESDIDRLVDDARKKAFGINDSEILHIIPKNYKIDKILGDTLISKIDANKIIMFIKEKW